MAKGGKTELFYTIRVDDKGGFVIDELNKKVRSAEGAFKALEKAILKNTNSTRVSVNELKNLRNELIRNRDSMALTAKEYANYTQQIDKVNTRIHEFQVQAKGVTKVNGDMQSSAGLAGAATIELGRVFSDAGYGIRGVANNIQQLASLFITLSVSAGGAGKALDLIGKQLKGPLGILVLFQGLISLIEFLDRKYKIFSGGLKEVNKELEKQKESLAGSQGTIEILRTYAGMIDNSNVSIEAQEIALQKLKKNGFDPAIGSLEQFIEAQQKLMMLKVAEGIFGDEAKKVLKERMELTDKIAEANEKVSALREKYSEEQLKQPESIAMGSAGVGAFNSTRAMTPSLQLELAQNEQQDLTEQRANLDKGLEKLSDGLQKEIDSLASSNPFLAVLIGGNPKKSSDKVKPDLDEFFNNLLIEGVGLKEIDLGLKDARVVDEFDVALNEYIEFIDEFKIEGEKFEDDRINAQEKASIDRLKNMYDSMEMEIEGNILFEEDLLKIKEFYANKRKELGEEENKDEKKRIKSLRKSIMQASRAIQSVISDLMSMQRDNAKAEIEQIDARANALLSKEGITASERNKILESAEAEKERINRKAIKNELKLQQIKFGIMAAELSAKIALDFSEGVISLKKGAANSASAGFPNNIPLLLAYGAQAASILIGMNQAKKQANSALSSIGGSAASTASTSAADVAPPSFNVVGQSASSQLATALDAMMPETPPVVVMAGDINDAMENYNKAKVESGI